MAAADTAPDQRAPTEVIVSCLVATVAFWAYSRTLLPGVDLGDTGGFQASAVWRESTGRESYPLYFTLAHWFVGLASAENPARGLNLFSAVSGAAAVGLLCAATARITRSLAGGAVAGLMLAFSYTFWTQAIIAEVYTLHLALTAACLLALLAFERHPSRTRLAVFFAVYALSFGNHYSMILWLVPFAIFLIQAHPRPRELFRPPTIAMAVAMVIAGVALYASDFVSAWTALAAPDAWSDRLGTIWFDLTKADWRDTMIGGVDASQASERVAMWWWDARQQFGIAGLVVAAAGLVALLLTSRRWALLVAISYLLSTAFALSYNVGDVHVFFLPAHFCTALAAGAAVGGVTRAMAGQSRTVRYALALGPLVAIGYAGWLGWEAWPAVDRHDDSRPQQLVSRLTQGLHAQDTVLLSGLEWQSENALLYSARQNLHDLAWTRLADVLPHLPFFVADNASIGRGIALTSEAAATVVAAYGPLFPIVPDDPTPVRSVAEVAAQLPPGTPYVLTLLPPTGADRLNPAELSATLAALTGEPEVGPRSSYEVWAGSVGERPVFRRSEARPFRTAFTLAGDRFTIRMESWIPADTFRRAGFGRLLRGREPMLTVERGLSLVWLRPDGTPLQTYAAGLYAPPRRFRISARAEGFALCSKACEPSSSSSPAPLR